MLDGKMLVEAKAKYAEVGQLAKDSPRDEVVPALIAFAQVAATLAVAEELARLRKALQDGSVVVQNPVSG